MASKEQRRELSFSKRPGCFDRYVVKVEEREVVTLTEEEARELAKLVLLELGE